MTRFRTKTQNIIATFQTWSFLIYASLAYYACCVAIKNCKRIESCYLSKGNESS